MTMHQRIGLSHTYGAAGMDAGLDTPSRFGHSDQIMCDQTHVGAATEGI
jgi:hypothetical protein